VPHTSTLEGEPIRSRPLPTEAGKHLPADSFVPGDPGFPGRRHKPSLLSSGKVAPLPRCCPTWRNPGLTARACRSPVNPGQRPANPRKARHPLAKFDRTPSLCPRMQCGQCRRPTTPAVAGAHRMLPILRPAAAVGRVPASCQETRRCRQKTTPAFSSPCSPQHQLDQHERS